MARLPNADGTIHIGLARELATHVVVGSYNVFSILNEIGLLEELSPHLSRSKRASRFTRAPLRGLWEKHHIQAHFILQNIMKEWTRGDSFEKVFRSYYGMTLATDITGRIARELVHTAYQARASGRRLTGEWIVFDKQPTGNHYLRLARHAEDDSGFREDPTLSGRGGPARLIPADPGDRWIAIVNPCLVLCEHMLGTGGMPTDSPGLLGHPREFRSGMFQWLWRLFGKDRRLRVRNEPQFGDRVAEAPATPAGIAELPASAGAPAPARDEPPPSLTKAPAWLKTLPGKVAILDVETTGSRNEPPVRMTASAALQVHPAC